MVCSDWQMVQRLQSYTQTCLVTLLGRVQWWEQPEESSMTSEDVHIGINSKRIAGSTHTQALLTFLSSSPPFKPNLGAMRMHTH